MPTGQKNMILQNLESFIEDREKERELTKQNKNKGLC
jgi:hypothetical protein